MGATFFNPDSRIEALSLNDNFIFRTGTQHHCFCFYCLGPGLVELPSTSSFRFPLIQSALWRKWLLLWPFLSFLTLEHEPRLTGLFILPRRKPPKQRLAQKRKFAHDSSFETAFSVFQLLSIIEQTFCKYFANILPIIHSGEFIFYECNTDVHSFPPCGIKCLPSVISQPGDRVNSWTKNYCSVLSQERSVHTCCPDFLSFSGQWNEMKNTLNSRTTEVLSELGGKSFVKLYFNSVIPSFLVPLSHWATAVYGCLLTFVTLLGANETKKPKLCGKGYRPDFHIRVSWSLEWATSDLQG